MRYEAIIFDFDGVIIESEAATNAKLAALLSGYGHPTTLAESMTHYMGLSGSNFVAAIEQRIGQKLPERFHAEQEAAHQSLMVEGVAAVTGAVAFIRALPPIPRAIASSSSTAWIRHHLSTIGLADAFGDMIFSGREHVEHGKPDPSLYILAAAHLGADPARTVIIEDSPVGVRGALASGMHVIGFTGGTHCLPGHADRLRALGVKDIADSFEDVASLIA